MKIEQHCNYWIAEQRLDTGRLLIAEGTSRQDARRQLQFLMMDHHDALPVIDVHEEFLCPDTFNNIFGKR